MDPHFDGVIFQTHGAELRRRVERPFPPSCVLDLRPRKAFETAHVPGARPVTVESLEAGLPDGTTEHTEFFVVGEDHRDRAVRSASLALLAHGAHRVVELAGGMREWSLLGLPVEESPDRAA